MMKNSLVRALLNRICRALRMNIYYHTKYGYKTIHGKKDNQPSIKRPRKTIICSTDDLYLGVDGLYDEYSHAGIPVRLSPHYDLMNACEKKQLSDDCVYYELEKKGALDSRDCITRSIERHYEAYNKAKTEIESGSYKPVLFYRVEGKKIIFDGKHRAALCAFLGFDVIAYEIDPFEACSNYILKLRKYVRKHPDLFSKQIKFIDAITVGR